jgi:nucleoside-diphosphate-sugar epimerase
VGSTEENYRKLDIVELLQRRLPDARVRYVHKDEDPRDYRVAFEKIDLALGYRPRYTVGDGIDEIMALLRSGIVDEPAAGVYRN